MPVINQVDSEVRCELSYVLKASILEQQSTETVIRVKSVIK